MNSYKGRNLPSIIQEESFDVSPYYSQNVYVPSPEYALAQSEPIEYLSLLKTKLKNDHEENMSNIFNTHKQVMKGMEYHAANNYIAGLSSSDRLEIESVSVVSHVIEKGWLFDRKVDGITIKVNRR